MIEDSNQIENDINFLNSLLKNRQLDELKEKADLFINKYPEHYVGFFFVAVYHFYNNNFTHTLVNFILRRNFRTHWNNCYS